VFQNRDLQQRVVIRILLNNIPTILLQVLMPVFNDQQDMEVLPPIVGNNIDLLTSIRLFKSSGKDVDVVILNLSPVKPPPPICSQLLGEWPDLKVLVINPFGDTAALYWRGLRQRKIQTPSAEKMIKLIRNAVVYPDV
jgi:hypothetical protein